ncbi:unnamed protein product [Anisakis simplex]|uniref:Apolipoprotein L3-like n=1 Tax=Anisakis simplex TaxID=6269 RepID=A0A0M3JS00_ANISI|nr:unnamed protein product [Anisakis simplex]
MSEDNENTEMTNGSLRGSDMYINSLRVIANEVQQLREEIDDLLCSKRDYYEVSRLQQSKLFEAKKIFLDLYDEFVRNRISLIDLLTEIAEEAKNVKKSCNISMITGSSVGLAGGITALVGTVAFPPLFLGGLVVSGLAAISNIGTKLAEFAIFHQMLKKVEEKLKIDNANADVLESVYEEIKLGTLFDLDSIGSQKTLSSPNFDISSLGKVGSGAVASAVGLGFRSLGLKSTTFTTTLLRGFTRSVIGISILIDGVTIVISTRDLNNGSRNEFAQEVLKLANVKKTELDELRKKGFESIKMKNEDVNFASVL